MNFLCLGEVWDEQGGVRLRPPLETDWNEEGCRTILDQPVLDLGSTGYPAVLDMYPVHP